MKCFHMIQLALIGRNSMGMNHLKETKPRYGGLDAGNVTNGGI